MSVKPSLRVLVVDDDAVVRDVLATMLSVEGCEVLTAADGPAGLALAERAWPDVVLLDVAMPGLSGLEVCRALKSGSPPPKVVMVTAKSSAEDRARGRAAGADAYLAKPFSPLVLFELVGLGTVGAEVA